MALGGFTSGGIVEGLQSGGQRGLARQQLALDEQALGQRQAEVDAKAQAARQEQAGKMFWKTVDEAMAVVSSSGSKSSEQFWNSPAGQSVMGGLEEARQLAQLAGIPDATANAAFMKVRGTPTEAEAATRKALSEAEASTAAKLQTAEEIEAKTGVSEREALISAGVLDRPPQPRAAQGINFKMPDGSIRNINAFDAAAVQAARDAGGVQVGLSVQSSNLGDLTALTEVGPKDVAAARANVEDTSAQLQAVGAAAKAFADNPEAGGLMAPIIENVGGLLQQFDIGKEMLAQADIDPAKVSAVRDRARITVSQMLETITGEESGRFTAAERQIAEDTLKALKVTASPEQIQASFETVQSIMKPALVRDALKLLSASKIDLASEKGIDDFGDVLVSNGMTQDQAEETIMEIMISRGIVVR